MMEQMKKTLLYAVIITGLSGAMFLPGMGRLPLLDRDEPRFAEAGRHMLATGDYLVPYFNNEVRYDKPPAIYWVMTLGYRIFGVNEIGARIGSALAGMASCLLIFFVAKAMFGSRVALVAGLAAPLTVLVFIESRIATADALLLLSIMLMFWGMWRVREGHRGLTDYGMIYGALALGSLTKGPVPMAVMAAACLSEGFLHGLTAGQGIADRIKSSLREFIVILRQYRAAPGIAAAALIVMLWFIPAVIRTDGGFLRDGFYHHVVDRSFGPEAHESHAGIPVVYYILLLPLTFFPWFAFLPAGIRTVRRMNPSAAGFLFAWAIAPFLVFSFLRTKLPHYVMPGYPALIIISAAGLAEAMRSRENIWKPIWGKFGLTAFLLVGLAISVGIALAPVLLDTPGHLLYWLPPASAALLMTTAAFAGFATARNRFGYTAIVVMMAATIGLFASVTLPTVGGKYYMYRDVAGDIVSVCPETETVATLGGAEPSLIFYLSREGISVVPSGSSSIDDVIAEHEHLLILARGERMSLPRERGGVMVMEFPRCLNTAKARWDELTLWKMAP